MKKLFISICLILLFAISPAFASRTIYITKNPTADIVGNLNGTTWLDSKDNTVYFAKNGLDIGNFSIYGALPQSKSDITGNTVSISASLSNIGVIFGAGKITSSGGSDTYNASNNTVNINETSHNTYTKDIYGAIGGGEVRNNKVIIKSGAIAAVYGGYGFTLASDYVNRIVDSNSVYLSDLTSSNTTTKIYGAEGSDNKASSSTIAVNVTTNNSVEIKNSTFVGATIAGVRYGRESSGNSVSIENSTIEGNIYGSITNVDIPEIKVSNNSVSIVGGSVVGNIYGGYIVDGMAINNVVNIDGTPDLSQASIFGGVSESGSGEVSGNILNLQTTITVLSASGFDNYNFYTDGLNLNIPMLTATDSAIDMDNTIVGLYLKDNSHLSAGDKIFLVSNMSGNSINQASGKMRSGATAIYDWEILVDGSDLYAQIKQDIEVGGNLNPETKSLLEGHLSSLGVLVQGADLIADSNDTLDSMLYDDSNGMFSGINVSSIKLNSGSHVDIQSGSLLVGLGSKINNYTYGAFLEAGSGKHNTYNEFEDSIVKGDGKNAYAGAGFLGRLSFDFIYVDGSIRAGYATTRYSADYSPDAKYNIGSLYYSGHAGVGLLQNISDKFTLNEYVKYLATMQQGQTITLDTKEEINFANIMSSRATAGLRAKYNGVYLGYAYEQEMAGEANATTANTAIESPIIKGATQVIEAGYNQSLSLRASRFYESSGFNVGMGGKYYIGTRNGFSANMKIGYLF
ncbi:MAG: hypothetical protein LBQ34_01705 [Alphaproteobacteria bacterium]|jgi:hypothetical protein|nr:hypothetical protein [Alphaproteobacteria bacterium]